MVSVVAHSNPCIGNPLASDVNSLRALTPWWFGENKTNSMLHSGLLDLMNRSTCFGHYYAHHQELATIQMVTAYGSSPWLWQVAGLVHGCRFLKRPVRGMFHDWL